MGDQFQRVSCGETKTGVFDDYSVFGRRCKENGAVWWEIKLQPGKNGVYWIKDEEFYHRQNDLLTPGVREEQLGSPTKYGHVDPKEKKAALKAIKEWESPGRRCTP